MKYLLQLIAVIIGLGVFFGAIAFVLYWVLSE